MFGRFGRFVRFVRFVFMHFLMDGWPVMGRSSFLMSGCDDGSDRLGVVVEVRDNFADSSLFRYISKVCLFFCLKNTIKKDINY